MHEELPDRLLSPDGRSGWYAHRPDGIRLDEDEAWEAPPVGSTIRLMWDHGVEVPLWSDEGLLFGAREDLERHFSVGKELAADLVAWAAAWEAVGGAGMDAEAASLVHRLNSELHHRYTFVYQP